MNTAQAMQRHFQPELESQIMSLLFSDGFGFDEAYAHADAYARIIFGNISPTGLVLVRRTLRRLENSAVRY